MNSIRLALVITLTSTFATEILHAQDYGGGSSGGDDEAPPPGMADCNGVFLTYVFGSREKEYPRLKNATAQSWAFKSTATIANGGTEEVLGWKIFVGFRNKELLVSVTGAISADGSFPLDASNGTTFVGSDNADLKTSIETAGEYSQISQKIEITGTLFGGKATTKPMPKTIKLTNDGWKCSAPKTKGGSMEVCCKKDPKFKAKDTKTKYMPRQNGDLNIDYDILQAYQSSYLAQVTMNNDNPLGRLDHWNVTWEWMRGEFINTMRGAYPHVQDTSGCLYGKAGQYYTDLDFSKVLSCDKKPILGDLPPERKNDTETGRLPGCCRNGSLLPTLMDPSKSKSVFQLQVYKLPPDTNKTAFYPPQHWKIDGVLNPQYKCGPPIRVDPSVFPDPSGLQAITFAIATWQVVCNITKPKPRASRCCVSYSAFYNDSAVPCNTCACGCDGDADADDQTCDSDASQMLLPPEALLVPFENRTAQAKAWARRKHFKVPKKLPCPDNCGVTLNWHLNSDFKTGWTARITLFNWKDVAFEDWFAAIDLGKSGEGYEKVYSFNATRVPPQNKTILFQGLPGLNFLVGVTNGSDPKRVPPVPGKMQSVISFTKKGLKGLDIPGGDGFPKRVLFNGEECALPRYLPKSSADRLSAVGFTPLIVILTVGFVAVSNRLFVL